jgi:phage I-like protein
MKLPTQFRLFRKGVNTSTKGTVIFDAKAAEAVMSDYAQHNADLMLDLEHLSIKRDAPNYNPDAMGWFKLALRNGELWAVDVRYTPEGASRLENKKQRYISPYFMVEKATKRVVQIVNSALTALPATDGPMALVAASRVQTHGLMAFSIVGNPMDLSVLCELLGLPADATLDDIAAAIKALQEGKTPAAGETPPAPVASSEVPPAAEASAPPATTPKKTTVSIQHSQDPGATAVIALTREVQELKAERLKDKRDALIKANANKLTPVLEAWARTQTIETLTEYFKAAAPVEAGTEIEGEREAQANSRGTTQEITLSQEEIEVCRKSGVSQESVLAYKKAQKG